MITFLQYIKEQFSNDLSPNDICDFYYLSYIYQTRGGSIASDESFVFNERLQELKTKYLTNIGNLIKKQLIKYKSKGRHDSDLSIPSNLDFNLLHINMQKTYRSDMSRRNTKWEFITNSLQQLNKSSSVKDIIFYIDRINNAVHNTDTGLLEKIDPMLLKVLDTVHNAKTPHDFLHYVSGDVKKYIKLL